MKLNITADTTKINDCFSKITNSMIKDKDQILVNQFIEALDKVSREMELLNDSDNIGYVLIVKLKRIYEEYEETVLSNNSFDSLIDYYAHLQTKKREQKKEEDKEETAMRVMESSEYYYEKFTLQIKILSSGSKIAECKEIGFYYMTSAEIEHIINEFRKAVNTKLQNDKEKDEDLFLVETFLEKLTIIHKQMEKLKDNPNRHLVLDVKLGKIYEKAKDVFHLSSYENFKTYYFMKFPLKATYQGEPDK